MRCCIYIILIALASKEALSMARQDKCSQICDDAVTPVCTAPDTQSCMTKCQPLCLNVCAEWLGVSGSRLPKCQSFCDTPAEAAKFCTVVCAASTDDCKEKLPPVCQSFCMKQLQK